MLSLQIIEIIESFCLMAGLIQAWSRDFGRLLFDIFFMPKRAIPHRAFTRLSAMLPPSNKGARPMRTTTPTKTEAFGTEIETLLPDLTRFARVLTRNEDDAHDLVQDCVERALRKHELYQDGTSLQFRVVNLLPALTNTSGRRESELLHSAGSGERQDPC